MGMERCIVDATVFGGSVKGVLAGLAVCMLLGISRPAFAQITQTVGPCDINASSCSESTQSVGNPTTTSTATNSTSTSSQSDTSANQNGNTISPVVTVTPQDNMSNGANTNDGNSTTANGGGGGSSTASGNSLNSSNSAAIGNTTTGPSTSSANNNSNSGGNVNSSGSGNVTSAGNGNVTGGSNNGNTKGGAATTNSGSVSGGAGGNGGSIGSVAPVQTLSSQQGQSSRLTGGNQTAATSNENGQNVGTGNTTVNTNTNSTFKAIYIPPVVPPTPASQLAVGNIVKETMVCGPLMRKTSRAVEGTYFGLATDSKFEQGHDDTVEPVLDVDGRETYNEVPLLSDPRGDGFHRYGSQVVFFTAIVGLAGARNIAVGAGSAAGGWGQGGLGGSGSIQQMVTTAQIVPCDLGTYITRATDGDFQSLTRIHG